MVTLPKICNRKKDNRNLSEMTFDKKQPRERREWTPQEREEIAQKAQQREQAAASFRKKASQDNGVRELGRRVDEILSTRADGSQYVPRPRLNRKPKKNSHHTSNDSVTMRLNRYIAQSGVCSRRDADALIEQGLVKVNGKIAKELGVQVDTGKDVVEYAGRKLVGEKKVYIIMNKPKGVVTTLEDPHHDRTVIDLLDGRIHQRVYPVGRLDRETTGVLLLTNDGELTNELTHPSFKHKKIYHVFLDKPCVVADLETLANGIELEDGPIHADEISFVEGNKKEVGIEIHSGRNRIVRRMFEHLGYKVVKLDRVFFAGFTKMGLKKGFFRELSPAEVSKLLSKKW